MIFKLSGKNVVLFLILMFITSIKRQGIEMSTVRGLPFPYFIDGCAFMPGNCYENHFMWSFFILDIVILYFIASLIIFIWKRYKRG